ncbi:hypothetical protein CRUP_017616 [Coryphaenoides rupestris]|nr:hypothetical protein CRUP_017616 [Coryphaenoides rupestris]
MPPSHFTTAVQPAAGPGVSVSVSGPAAAWLPVSRPHEEVLELRRENQRLMMLLQGDTLRDRSRSTDSTGRARLVQVQQELQQNRQANHKMSSQLEVLEKESEEEIRRLRKEEARSREELQQLTSSHAAELEAATHTTDLRQRDVDTTATEMLRLQNSLETAAAERDLLRDQLSQARQAFEEQSTTLQQLRSYIGQLSPERGEEERLVETVQKLTREKEALEKTADLLTVRLKCVNEILALQEQKLLNKTLSDPLLSSGGCEGLAVLRLWRKRVYSLCVQLRSQELQLKTERERNISAVKALEQEVQQEQLRNTLLQHGLDDRLAQLHLEEVAVQSLKEDMAAVVRENTELRSWKQQAAVEQGTLKEALQRFNAVFEAKVADVNKAQEQLNVFSQRLTFAKRRVQTIQGLLVRRVALQKVQHSSRRTVLEDERARRLQAELQLLGQERDELSQELRRTPELIDKALAQLRETSLQSAESSVSERLREMEAQVNTARREHTKAVMALRQLHRQVTREREQGRRDQQLQIDQSQKEIQDLQRRLKETERDRNLLLASVKERGHVTELRRGRMASTRPPDRPPDTTETLRSVLGDLKVLSSSVLDGSEGPEEGE